ncbi:hypothetical protein ALC56_03569, partial [Trachymyrmex septentrionalis]
AVIYLSLELRDVLCHETDPLDHLPAYEKYDHMATVAWPRQEQPCPIAGDFCMNGGTCLFFETVGEPACKEKRKEYKRRENVLLTLMSLLESTREIELTFLVTPLCAATGELAVSGVERSFTKCLLSIAREVEVLDSRRETRSLGRGLFYLFSIHQRTIFSFLLDTSLYFLLQCALLIPLSPSDSYARYFFQQ